MKILEVIMNVPGWNAGNLIEADDQRARELVQQGIARMITPEAEVFIEEPIVLKKKSKTVEQSVLESESYGS